MLDEQATDQQKKSVLVPLANTYYSKKCFSEMKDVCMQILKIDRAEPHALSLLKRLTPDDAAA